MNTDATEYTIKAPNAATRSNRTRIVIFFYMRLTNRVELHPDVRPTINQESAGTIHFTAAQAAGVTAKRKPFSSNRCQLQRIVRSWLFYLVVTPKGISFDHDNHSFASLLRCELSLLAPRSREPLRLLAAHFTLHNSIDEIIISLCNSITARPNS